jgi:hypothetical protein
MHGGKEIRGMQKLREGDQSDFTHIRRLSLYVFKYGG